MVINRIKFFSAMLCILYSVTAQAELQIVVDGGIEEPTHIAVVPFGWDGANALSEDISAIVANDLSRSGMFKLMEEGDMLSSPEAESQIFFRDWRISGNDFMLIGSVKPTANGVTATVELFDILTEKKLWSQTIDSAGSDLRDIAHYIADEVFQKITGIRGAFSTKIVYVTAQGYGPARKFKLQMADTDGARVQTILASNEPILSPTWSRDGKKLAYVSFETDRPAIYIQHLASGKRQKIQSFKGLNGAPAWDPTGNKLAIVLSKDGNPEIYVLNLQTGGLERITRHYGIDTEPTWTPDGKSIIFTSDRAGRPQIYRVNVASGDIKRLTFKGRYNSRGRITQDGRFLTMVHQDDLGYHIAVQDLNTGRLDILTNSKDDESPTISPNGVVIMYATKAGRRGVLAGVSLDGKIKFTMPNSSGDVREPAWSPFLN
ncbi:MAG: Tol-Pal system beta propeller repeat protein TolB [Oceanospirillaceae bacterium]